MTTKIDIIEQTAVGKISQETCEDGTVVTDDFAAIIDGATNKSKSCFSTQESNGRLAMLTISDVIRALPRNSSVSYFCDKATEAIRDIYLERDAVNRMMSFPEERLTASVIIYSASKREVWMIGDCQALIGGVHYDNPKPADILAAKIRSAFIKKKIAEKVPFSYFLDRDEGREQIVPLIIDCCKFQNDDANDRLGFSVIDGFKVAASHVRIIKVSESEKEVILASDGYPILKSSLRETEEALALQLKHDPLCINTFLSTKGIMNGRKSFDDRSYLRIGV